MQELVDSDMIDAAAEAAPTSLDPYGQLLKMLFPRALNIAIYDRNGTLMWNAGGCESESLQQLIEDEVANNLLSHSEAGLVNERYRQGMLHSIDGDHAYVFPLMDSHYLLSGVVVITCAERTGQNSRTQDSTYALLRPALEVLSRELINQTSIESLQRHLRARDGDLALVMGDSAEHQTTDDFNSMLQDCINHLECPLGAALIPDKNIAMFRTAEDVPPNVGAEVLNRTHRHLLALVQVQRHTVVLNKSITQGPMANLPYKILACPINYGSHNSASTVAGVLTVFKDADNDEFTLREIRIVELVARRISQVLQTAYDTSTGLLTRPALEKRAANILGESNKNQTHHVVYIDIDRLHVLNETFGMHIGDDVISRIGEVIRSMLTPSIAAARISGDRFALFVPNSSADSVRQYAENLCNAVNKIEYRVQDKQVETSASFGVAPVQATENPLSHALASAEAACKAAKDRGRGRVEVYQDEDHSIVRRVEDVSLLGAIREALEQDRFRMDAQPIVELNPRTGRQHFELLIRMLNENGELIQANKFLTAAERYQLAPAIDRWVVNYVLELISAAAPRLLSVNASFAINISGQSLGDDEFRNYLEDRLRTYSLSPSLLSFEVTETAAVSNIVRAETLIRRLRKLGHEVALDDFGRGLSSLTYLKSLPVNSVKIDGELIRDVTHNQRSQAMVSAVVQLARAMKLETTAECIESAEIQQAIANLGVDHAQGFAIGRPRPLELTLNELMGVSNTSTRRILGNYLQAG
jgi:diguanylate cyclase (GGDEF)-like protein